MNCPNCGTMNENDAIFCADCGTKMQSDETIRVTIPVQPVTPEPQPAPTPVTPAEQGIPAAYKPLSPWAYFGWQLLFAIPVVNFVLLIVMSFAPRNKNLKNYARSYWCAVLVGVIIALVGLIVLAVIAVVAGVGIGELIQYIE